MQVKPLPLRDFSCVLKKELNAFCFCCFISYVHILPKETFFINTLIWYLFFPVTNEMINDNRSDTGYRTITNVVDGKIGN